MAIRDLAGRFWGKKIGRMRDRGNFLAHQIFLPLELKDISKLRRAQQCLHERLEVQIG
jgi:hypothetical protein